MRVMGTRGPARAAWTERKAASRVSMGAAPIDRRRSASSRAPAARTAAAGSTPAATRSKAAARAGGGGGGGPWAGAGGAVPPAGAEGLLQLGELLRLLGAAGGDDLLGQVH